MDKEILIKTLRDLSVRLGTRKISKSMVDNDSNTACSTTYARYFGTWGNAVSAAGLETGKITGRPWDPPIRISGQAIEIIEGELLGDGTLEHTPTSGNANFAHSTTNHAYSQYLEKNLSEAGLQTRWELLPPRKEGGKWQRRIRTVYNQSFRPILERWYPEGVKIVPDDLVLSRTRCLFWYLGDGYIENKVSKFSTCGFQKDEVRRLADMMVGLGFRASVDRHSGGYPVLRLLTDDSRRFLEWLGPCPVDGYEHRWVLHK